jgi:hypothetical protein
MSFNRYIQPTTDVITVGLSAAPIMPTITTTGSFTLFAPTTNTGVIWIGDVDVNPATFTGQPLAAGESMYFDARSSDTEASRYYNLNEYFVRATAASQGLVIIYNGGIRTGQTLQVSASGSLDVQISAANDSVRLGDGTDLTNVTTAGQLEVLAGGSTVAVTVTPTIDTTAYAAGDQIGTVQTLSNVFRLSTNGTSTLQSITVLDLAKQNIPLDFLFFNASPTTGSNNAPVSISDSEMGTKCIGMVTLGSNYSNLADNSISTTGQLGIPLSVASGTSLFVVVVARFAATYGVANGLRFTYTFYQD